METNLDKIAKAVHKIEAAAQRQKAKAVKKTMKWLLARKADIDKQIEQLQSLVGFGSSKAVKATKAPKTGKGKGKRIRRGPEQLKADAEKIVAFLKSHP